MIQALWFMVVLAALALAGVWLADHPGSVTVLWQGYRLDSSVALLVSVVAVIAVVAALVYRFWIVLLGLPSAFGRRRTARRRRRGFEALTRGMVAVAAGDAEDARRQGKRAEGLLEDPPLTLLLSAQAAQLAGDEQAAERFFTAMLERPETEFLGLRGLLTQGIKRHDWDEALALARRAYRLRPEERLGGGPPARPAGAGPGNGWMPRSPSTRRSSTRWLLRPGAAGRGSPFSTSKARRRNPAATAARRSSWPGAPTTRTRPSFRRRSAWPASWSTPARGRGPPW